MVLFGPFLLLLSYTSTYLCKGQWCQHLNMPKCKFHWASKQTPQQTSNEKAIGHMGTLIKSRSTPLIIGFSYVHLCIYILLTCLVHIKVKNLKIDLTLHGTTYMYTYVFNKLYSVQARSAQFIFHEKIPTQRVVDTFSRDPYHHKDSFYGRVMSFLGDNS